MSEHSVLDLIAALDAAVAAELVRLTARRFELAALPPRVGRAMREQLATTRESWTDARALLTGEDGVLSAVRAGRANECGLDAGLARIRELLAAGEDDPEILIDEAEGAVEAAANLSLES